MQSSFAPATGHPRLNYGLPPPSEFRRHEPLRSSVTPATRSIELDYGPPPLSVPRRPEPPRSSVTPGIGNLGLGWVPPVAPQPIRAKPSTEKNDTVQLPALNRSEPTSVHNVGYGQLQYGTGPGLRTLDESSRSGWLFARKPKEEQTTEGTACISMFLISLLTQ